MKSELNSKDYVTFARKFVKETVDIMDIEELKSIVSDHIHEMIQEGEDTYGQEGAFEEMKSWDEGTFLSVAEDFELELEGVMITSFLTGVAVAVPTALITMKLLNSSLFISNEELKEANARISLIINNLDDFREERMKDKMERLRHHRQIRPQIIH
jgi:hypothetical protein